MANIMAEEAIAPINRQLLLLKWDSQLHWLSITLNKKKVLKILHKKSDAIISNHTILGELAIPNIIAILILANIEKWLKKCAHDTFKFRLRATYPDSKVHGANMAPIWGLQDPGGPYVGPMNLAIWVSSLRSPTE